MRRRLQNGVSRWWVWGCFAGLVASCGGEPRPPKVESLTPGQCMAGLGTEVTISGKRFDPVAEVDFRSDEGSVVSQSFAVFLGDIPLLDVARIDRRTLTARVPVDLPAGVYPVRVEAPNGSSETLPDAFEVVACKRPEDCGSSCRSEAACSDGVCLGGTEQGIDLDGDGFADYRCGGTDCDDADQAVFPGAAEVVDDGVDQDCDGGDACYEDLDGDGCGTHLIVADDDLDCGNGSAFESAIPGRCDPDTPFGASCDYGETHCRVCTDACTETDGLTSYCGDGVTDEAHGETCDDGNTVTEVCAYGLVACEVCDASCSPVAGGVSYCGDGIADGAVGEVCDDGPNNGAGDGWCQRGCDGIQRCGDNVVTGTETCDDGNAVTEACEYGVMMCQVCGASCTEVFGAISYCGDGVADGARGEACDDGASNGTGNGFCLGNCSDFQVCGDGETQGTEVCDDGNTNDCVGDCLADCSATITVTGCGDGVVCGTEVCDDGDTDSCTGDCVADCSGPTGCGDGACCPNFAEDDRTCEGDCCPQSCSTCAAGECCTSACAGTCSYSCAAGCGCHYDCAGATDCNINCNGSSYCMADCTGASACDVVCDNGVECDTQYAGGGDALVFDCNHTSQCTYDCADAAVCEGQCRNGSTCELNCTNAGDCSAVNCVSGAECLMDCTGSMNCAFNNCEGGVQTCPGEIVVCNRACP